MKIKENMHVLLLKGGFGPEREVSLNSAKACSKAIRCEDYYDNPKLLEELGDVQCMIELILDNELLSWEDVRDRIKIKKEKLKKYTNLFND